MRRKALISATGAIPRSLLLLLATVAPFPLAQAQRAGAPSHSSGAHSHSSGASFARGNGPYRSASRRLSPLASPYSSLPFPFFGDSFDPNDIYSSGYPVASQAPPFLMEALRSLSGGPGAGPMGPAMGAVSAREPSSSEPLMIELQNGRYVRVKSSAADGEAAPISLSKDSGAALSRVAAAPASPVLPAAVLIFHDGHREEVRDYSIADGSLYARGDFYTDGYWNKKIDLANLDVAQTRQANLARNVKFVLPSSPNEVITRP
jgi:hypothetical protein